MKCLKENCIHHAVCALYTFSGYNSDECAFYETRRPHGEWIPCSERLPEEMEDVLVWYEYFSYKRNKMVQTYGIGNVYKDFWCGDVQGERAKCIAWMPLPKPYQKEGEAE